MQPMLPRVLPNMIRQQTNVDRLDDPRCRCLQVFQENVRNRVCVAERLACVLRIQPQIAEHFVFQVTERDVARHVLALQKGTNFFCHRQLGPQISQPMHGAPGRDLCLIIFTIAPCKRAAANTRQVLVTHIRQRQIEHIVQKCHALLVCPIQWFIEADHEQLEKSLTVLTGCMPQQRCQHIFTIRLNALFLHICQLQVRS